MRNYPKSGNNWTQNLRGERFLCDRFAPRARQLSSKVGAPDVYCRLYYRRYGTPMFF